MRKYFFFAFVSFIFLSLQIFGQNPSPTPIKTTSDADEKNSDLVITANVRADELKFEVVPNPKVEFSSNKQSQTTWEADRENLPKPIEPGIVYRNIGVQLRIFSRFGVIQKIIIEMLDEPDPASTNNDNEQSTVRTNQNNLSDKTIPRPKNN